MTLERQGTVVPQAPSHPSVGMGFEVASTADQPQTAPGLEVVL